MGTGTAVFSGSTTSFVQNPVQGQSDGTKLGNGGAPGVWVRLAGFFALARYQFCVTRCAGARNSRFSVGKTVGKMT